MPPNLPDYPGCLKYILNLGQEKPMLINSANMLQHLHPFSHWSIYFSSDMVLFFWVAMK